MRGLVLAYHGCDLVVRDKLVKGELKNLTQSKNKYDWLGDGSYFFEGDEHRALQYATTASKDLSKNLTIQPIGTPAVVGVVLAVERWLDLTTQNGILNFESACKTLTEGFAHSEEDLPTNRAAFEGDEDFLHRAFDRAVFQIIHSQRATAHKQALDDGNSSLVIETAPFQATRGGFKQGISVGPTSAIHGQSHIQIALHDEKCVKGWFLVPGQRLASPAEFEAATVALADAKRRKTAAKPRVRSSSKPYPSA